jgi:hypothetical protein
VLGVSVCVLVKDGRCEKLDCQGWGGCAACAALLTSSSTFRDSMLVTVLLLPSMCELHALSCVKSHLLLDVCSSASSRAGMLSCFRDCFARLQHICEVA